MATPPRILSPLDGQFTGPSFVPLPKAPAQTAVPQKPGPVVVSQVADPLLVRTAYFDGRLLTADDLIRDQQYLDERLLELGRVLGDGVVSGLALALDETNQLLRVT